MHTAIVPINNKLLGTSFQNGPCVAKPTRASAVIGAYILLNIDALVGIAIPTEASVSDRASSLTQFLNYRISKPLRGSTLNSIDTPMGAKALAAVAPKGS